MSERCLVLWSVLFSFISITVYAQPYKKVLFVGNSITNHGPLAEIGWNGSWGMAASSQENDYLHRVMAEIRKTTPEAIHDQMNTIGFERDWKNFNYDQISYHKVYAADLIIMRFGENVNDWEVESGDLRTSYLRLLDAIAVPKSKIILTTTFWKNRDRFNAMIQSIAAERNLVVANLTDLSDDPSNKAYGLFSNPGVAEHPGDKGMAAIAGRIFKLLETNPAPTPEPPTVPEPPTEPAPPASPGTTTVPVPPTPIPPATGPSPRYLSLSILNVVSGDFYLPVIQAAADAGVNSFLLNVNWERIYSKRGEAPDWSQIDKQADLAISLGCKLMLRVWTARHNDGDQGWWPEETRPVSGDGIKRGLLGGYSFSDQNAVNEANAFVREVMEHFRPRQQAGHILFVSVVTTNASEIGYSVDAFNPILQENTLQVFDYSYHSLRAFREWARNKYKTLTNLNKVWNSDFSNFDDITPPYVYNNPWSAHYYKIGEDWYLFRHWALKNLMAKFRATVRQVDPTYKYYEDMGSCYDPLSIIRATLGFKDLCKDSDGLKINDAPHYNHRFAMDLIRSNLPGKMIGNEFEAVSLDYRNDWKQQVDESFEHGADWVNIFGFDRLPFFYEVEPLVRQTAATWLSSPKPPITTTQTVTYTLSEAFRDGNTSQVEGRWNTEYEASKKPIRVLLMEDMLGETTFENALPTVQTPLTDQQATVSQWFQYDVPRTTFADADGFITGITATGLPSGMSLVDWRIEGRVFTDGQYTVSVTARDDKGAQVTTQFRLTVVASPSDNVFSLFKAGN
ncbi:MAG: beta-galactosidase, partial [Bacteroidetes bacterium]|nr:beta-galactosidase [Bacteroidota bacterium]